MSITAIRQPLVRITYGIYAWITLIGLVIPALIALIVTPTRRGRRQIARWGARLFLLLIGSPVKIEGMSSLPETPCVVVANHASYLDGIILTAALPPRFTFLIKDEMSKLPVAGLLLRRVGSEFVNRENERQRHRVARRLIKAAATGNPLAFFPEGTFDRTPGLKRFHAGAFIAASRAQLPIVPVVIRGARAKLPAKSWICAPGRLSVRICEPVYPDAHTSVAELEEASRRGILRWLDEPDLSLEKLDAD